MNPQELEIDIVEACRLARANGCKGIALWCDSVSKLGWISTTTDFGGDVDIPRNWDYHASPHLAILALCEALTKK